MLIDSRDQPFASNFVAALELPAMIRRDIGREGETEDREQWCEQVLCRTFEYDDGREYETDGERRDEGWRCNLTGAVEDSSGFPPPMFRWVFSISIVASSARIPTARHDSALGSRIVGLPEPRII
jgi:hypothetical protein